MKVVYNSWLLVKSKEKAQQEAHQLPADADADNDPAERPVPSEEIPVDAAEPADAAGEPAPAVRRRGRKKATPKHEHEELLQQLKEMQKGRHTLDIMVDVIGDMRVKLYAEAQLGS